MICQSMDSTSINCQSMDLTSMNCQSMDSTSIDKAWIQQAWTAKAWIQHFPQNIPCTGSNWWSGEAGEAEPATEGRNKAVAPAATRALSVAEAEEQRAAKELQQEQEQQEKEVAQELCLRRKDLAELQSRWNCAEVYQSDVYVIGYWQKAV